MGRLSDNEKKLLQIRPSKPRNDCFRSDLRRGLAYEHVIAGNYIFIRRIAFAILCIARARGEMHSCIVLAYCAYALTVQCSLLINDSAFSILDRFVYCRPLALLRGDGDGIR